MSYRILTAAFALTLVACGPGDDEPTKDTGSDDVGTVDMGTPEDTGRNMDTGGPSDMGTPDDTGGPGDDAGATDASGMDSGGMDAGSNQDMGGPDMSGCDRQGFVTVSQTATFDVPNDQFLYTGFDAEPEGDNVYAFISFEVYPYLGGMVAPQTYDFTPTNYADCNTCMLIFADCQRPDPCEKVFLVDTGRVVIAAADTMDGAPFQATFENVVLNEVTIDAQTFESTLVPDGETWCLDDFPANTTVDRME